MQPSKPWLESFSWEQVTAVNQSLCNEKSVPCQSNKKHDAARQKWDAAHRRASALIEALDLLKACNDLRPFVFNCSNTFTQVGRALVDPWAAQLGPTEAELLRRSVCHYVDGQIGRGEVAGILKFMESRPLVEVVKADAKSPAAPPVLPRVHREQPA